MLRHAVDRHHAVRRFAPRPRAAPAVAAARRLRAASTRRCVRFRLALDRNAERPKRPGRSPRSPPLSELVTARCHDPRHRDLDCSRAAGTLCLAALLQSKIQAGYRSPAAQTAASSNRGRSPPDCLACPGRPPNRCPSRGPRFAGRSSRRFKSRACGPWPIEPGRRGRRSLRPWLVKAWLVKTRLIKAWLIEARPLTLRPFAAAIFPWPRESLTSTFACTLRPFTAWPVALIERGPCETLSFARLESFARNLKPSRLN